MTFQTSELEKFVSLLDRYTPEEGLNETYIKSFATYRASNIHEKHPVVDEAGFGFIGQGKTRCYVGNRKYDFCGGDLITVIFPMAIEKEIIEAGRDKPYLAAGFRLNLSRLSEILLKIERIDGPVGKPESSDPSAIFPEPLDDNLLDAAIRLLETLANPRDAAIFGEMIIDEIYYRILSNKRRGGLRYLLQQRGQIQRISKAVEFIHQNIRQPVVIETLAEMVSMSRTNFFESFKDVMHLSPLQYIKSVKLFKAQTLIREGKNASEAGYLVGYNSPAQFSREYKRHFGFPPSAT